MLSHKFIYCLLGVALVAGTRNAAAADERDAPKGVVVPPGFHRNESQREWRPDQMDGVRQLAAQIENDAETLADIADEQRYRDQRIDQDLVDRLDNFATNADTFSHNVKRAWIDMDRTWPSYEELRREYAQITAIYPRLQGTRAVQTATRRLADSMRELQNYYPRVVASPRGSRLAPLAYEIGELSDNVYDAVRYETRNDLSSIMNSDKSNTVRRFKEVRDAAHEFRDQLNERPDNFSDLLKDFGKLVDRYNSAGSRITIYSPNVQEGFYEIGDLLREVEEELRDTITRERFAYSRPSPRSNVYSGSDPRSGIAAPGKPTAPQKFQKLTPEQKKSIP